MPSLSEQPELIGFFSYSRDDDRGSDGGLSRIRLRIQDELRAQLGRSEATLRLWQDAEAIPPGTLWESEISGAIDQSVFFIPIITPRVIQSEHCLIEFQKFLTRENELGRSDLVFPILYIDVPELKDNKLWRQHPTLRVVGARQYVDWCEYRFEPDAPTVRRAIAQFAAKIALSLKRNIPETRKIATNKTPLITQPEASGVYSSTDSSCSRSGHTSKVERHFSRLRYTGWSETAGFCQSWDDPSLAFDHSKPAHYCHRHLHFCRHINQVECIYVGYVCLIVA